MNPVLTRRVNTWATLTFQVSYAYTLFDDESSADNPLTVGSSVAFVRGSTTEFTGVITEIRRNEQDAQVVDVTCADPMWYANMAVASVDGVRQFGMATPSIDLTAVPMMYLTTWLGHPPEDKYPVYPAFYSGSLLAPATHSATSPWYGKDVCPHTTLLGNIAGASNTFTVTDIRAFQFPALIQVEDELIWCCNGYYDSDGDAQIKITTRGVLGTTAADHAASTEAYQRLLKPISDTGKVKLTDTPVATRITIGTDKYRIREDAACFAFIDDPSGYTIIAADYSVYDMDLTGATAAITLATFAREIIQAAASDLGAGFSSGDVVTTGLDRIYIPRIASTNVRYCLEALNQQITECQYKYTSTARRIIHYWDAPTNKWTWKSVSQGTASALYPYAVRKTEAVSLEALYNGALVTYQCDEPFSLIAAERMEHPTVGDATVNVAPGDATHINAVMYQQLERQNGYGWQADTTTTSHDIYTQYLLDNDLSTGWGLRADGVMAYGNEAGTPWEYILVAYFTGASTLDRAWFALDARMHITGSVIYELVGLTEFTPGDSQATIHSHAQRISKRLYIVIEDMPTRANLSPPQRSIWQGVH
jgi:hypothetical protein